MEARDIERRALNTLGLVGDGPLTVTLTPLVVLTTVAAPVPTTVTITLVTNAPDVTTTVYVDFPILLLVISSCIWLNFEKFLLTILGKYRAAATPTITVPGSSRTFIAITSTLPAFTRTRNVFTYTFTTSTTTRTITYVTNPNPTVKYVKLTTVQTNRDQNRSPNRLYQILLSNSGQGRRSWLQSVCTLLKAVAVAWRSLPERV
jgi:hypothetical protein